VARKTVANFSIARRPLGNARQHANWWNSNGNLAALHTNELLLNQYRYKHKAASYQSKEKVCERRWNEIPLCGGAMTNDPKGQRTKAKRVVGSARIFHAPHLRQPGRAQASTAAQP